MNKKYFPLAALIVLALVTMACEPLDFVASKLGYTPAATAAAPAVSAPPAGAAPTTAADPCAPAPGKVLPAYCGSVPVVPPTAVGPAAPAAGDTCGSVPMTDYSQALSATLYNIDVGGPDQREILNLWTPGTKERTYIVGKMTTKRSFFTAYGNKRLFHEPDCNWHNLLVEAVTYAQRTTASNHTGEVWQVFPDGTTKMLIANAFGVTSAQLTNMADPTK